MHPRKIGGTTLLETVIAATLLATVSLAATAATRFVSDRGRTDVVEQLVLDQVRTQLVNLRSTARAGTIPTTGSTTSTVTLAGVKGNVSIQTNYSIASETSNVVMTNTTATWDDPKSRSVVVNSAFNKNRRPRVISFKFASTSSPAVSSNAFMGMVPTPFWNLYQTTSFSGAMNYQDSTGTSNSASLILIGASATQFTANLIPSSSANSPGDNFTNLFGSGLLNSNGNFALFYITPLPYAKYDVIVYAGLNETSVTGSLPLYINSRPARTITLPGSSDPARRQFVADANTFIERDLTENYLLIYYFPSTTVAPLHGIQIIEKL